MNQAALRAPQDYSKVALAIAPAVANAAVNGAAIDRTGYQSVIIDVAYATSGSPTGGSVTLQLQDSADGAAFANYGAAVVAPITNANAAGAVSSLAADLSGTRQYVRAVATPAPTGGANPAVTLSASARLFGPDRLPAL